MNKCVWFHIVLCFAVWRVLKSATFALTVSWAVFNTSVVLPLKLVYLQINLVSNASTKVKYEPCICYYRETAKLYNQV